MAYANGTNAPYGLKPVKTLSGAPWTNSIRPCRIASAYPTSIFTGDPVTILPDGTIGIGVAGQVTYGVFLGCSYLGANGIVVNNPYWPASTALMTGTYAIANIVADPHVIYDIQTSNTTGLVLDNVNNNCNFSIGTGNTATGISAAVLDLASVATTSTLNLKILDVVPTNPTSPWTTSTDFGIGYNSAYVTINNSLFNVGVAGI